MNKVLVSELRDSQGSGATSGFATDMARRAAMQSLRHGLHAA